MALIKQIVEISGINSIVLTKLDILDDLQKIKICVAYEIDGKKYDYLPMDIELQKKARPIYEEIDGWMSNSFGVEEFYELPENAKKYVHRIEEILGIKVEIISTGPKRDQTILI